MQVLDPTRVDAHVLRRQRLVPAAPDYDVVRLVKDISGLYAANATTPYLSLLARTPHFQRERLDEEIYTRRTLGRIRCMRKVLYILPIDLLVAAHWATRSLNVEASRRYLEYRGVSRAVYEPLARQIQDLLRGRELTASAIRHALRTALDVPALLSFMCDQGLLIRTRLEPGGPDLDFCYALFAEYYPRVRLEPMGEREAAMHLVRQYLRAFGPATEADIAAWTGLGQVSAHIAVEHMRGEVVRVQLANRVEHYLMLNTEVEACCQTPPLTQPLVKLLPSHDPYLLGYQDRSRYLDIRHCDRVFDQTGHVTSTIVVDGRVSGVWDVIMESRLMKLYLFQAADDELRASIEAAAQQLGRFICREAVAIHWCADMLPLTRQPLGSVATPLRNC